MVIKDEGDDHDHGLTILVRLNGDSGKSIREVCLSKTEASNASDNDGGLVDGDPPPIEVNRGSITVEKMEELVLRYGIPPSYVCIVPTISEYVPMPGSLKIGVCKETFPARLWVFNHLFVEELFRRYGLLPAQI